MYYSIIDVETTGFSPKLHDKIIEIAIVKTDDSGNIIDTFETLINPNRDVGATHIHGITAEMLVNAPLFKDISNELFNIFDGTAIVAHNARFDMSFLVHELKRAGHANHELPCICTLQLARKYLRELPSKKLEYICHYYDIPQDQKHSALSDSMATSRIFQEMIDEFDLTFPEKMIYSNTQRGTPTTNKVQMVTRESIRTVQEKRISPLKRLIDRLPEVKTNTVNEQQYLSLLDDILLDRVITEDELDVLANIADEHQISKKEMLELHMKYLESLIKIYLDDDIISESEKKDIDKVKKILMLDDIDTAELIEKVRNDHQAISGSVQQECAGKSVCFTGQLQGKMNGVPISREMAFELALSKGLVIKKGVVKNLDYLVLADVHSQSSKAKKARESGVTLISECAFWSMLGVQVE